MGESRSPHFLSLTKGTRGACTPISPRELLSVCSQMDAHIVGHQEQREFRNVSPHDTGPVSPSTQIYWRSNAPEWNRYLSRRRAYINYKPLPVFPSRRAACTVRTSPQVICFGHLFRRPNEFRSPALSNAGIVYRMSMDICLFRIFPKAFFTERSSVMSIGR